MMRADIDTAQWEYTYISAPTNAPKALIEKLNDLGAEGWQLATMDDVDRTLGVNVLTAVIRRPIDPLPSPAEEAEGWYPDPSGRYDLRLWNGRAWTFHVARKADKSTHRDPPTAREPTPDLTQ
jgi:uncharacterized protein DUF2510